LSITANQIDNKWVIRLEGVVDISFSNELKEALLGAVLSGKDFQIGLSEVTEIDVTAMQLLLAASWECKKAGRRFVLSGAVPANVRETFLEAGLPAISSEDPQSPETSTPLADRTND